MLRYVVERPMLWDGVLSSTCYGVSRKESWGIHEAIADKVAELKGQGAGGEGRARVSMKARC